MKEKVILAYSGGLDTSVILAWLCNKGYSVICFVADVGQQEDFNAIKEKALAIGADKVYVENLQQEFIDSYVFQALKANALYEGSYPLGTALARPLIAQKQVALAQKEGTTYLAHGATGKGNDQIRFELTYLGLMPNAHIISPWKDPLFLQQFKGRSDLIAYAYEHAIPITSTFKKPYSIDANIMHTSYEGGALEDPAFSDHDTIFQWTNPLDKTPDQPVQIAITFEKGIPVSVTNQATKEIIKGSLPLFSYLNKLGALHGIGRIDIVENRFVGMKSRGLYETPAGTILLKAHRDLEGLVLDKEVTHLKDLLMPKLAELIYNGFWFSPEMEFLMAAIDKSQEYVQGTVFLTLHKGNSIITGRTSHVSLYNADIASMDIPGGYNPIDAQGFITIQGLRLKLAHALKAKGIV
jgi:argininosuccinate synthase